MQWWTQDAAEPQCVRCDAPYVLMAAIGASSFVGAVSDLHL